MAGCVSALVALTAASLGGGAPAKAATKSKKATTRQTTTTKKRPIRTTTTKRRTTPPPARITTSTTTPTLPTVAAAPPTLTTSSTEAPTTTAAPVPAFDFDILVPTPAQSVAAGSTASYVVIVSIRAPSVPRAVTFFATGMPEGSNATLSPNPATSAAEFRVNVGSNVPVGTYTVRLIGSAANVTKTVNVFVNVTAATAASTSTTTTTTLASGPTSSTIVVGAGSSSFAVVVSSDGSKLRTGGTISYFIKILPAAGFTTPSALQFNGLPPGVSGTFSPMSFEGTATLFVSSTVAIIPGTYSFNLIAIAGSFQQFVPVRLIIE